MISMTQISQVGKSKNKSKKAPWSSQSFLVKPQLKRYSVLNNLLRRESSRSSSSSRKPPRGHTLCWLILLDIRNRLRSWRASFQARLRISHIQCLAHLSLNQWAHQSQPRSNHRKQPIWLPRQFYINNKKLLEYQRIKSNNSKLLLRNRLLSSQALCLTLPKKLG